MDTSKAGFTTFVVLGIIALFLIIGSIFLWPFVVEKIGPGTVTPSTTDTTNRSSYKAPCFGAYCNTPEYTPPDHQTVWILERNLATGSAEIYRFTERDSPYFALNNDNLYWAVTRELMRLNLTTGQLTRLFDLDTAATFGIKDRLISVQNPQIINDQWLFFSVGGYLTDGGLFYLPLTPNNESAKQIKGVRGGDVEKIGSHIFVTSGFGDGCHGSSTYSLLDTTTFTLKTVATLNGSCEEGEQFIGIDYEDRFLVAGYVGDEDGNQSRLTYVTAQPVAQPDVIGGVIAKQDMPKGIQVTALSQDKQMLFLSSLASIFRFDLKAQKMEKVFDFPKALSNIQGISLIEGNQVCVFLPREGEYDIDKIDTEAGTIDYGGTNCPERPSYFYDSRLEHIISELTLPKDYSFKKVVE